MTRPLPNELFDAIISRVPARAGRLGPEEKKTLLNCTLVCRDWLPASRHALFSCVVLNSPAAWDSFLRCVVNAEGGRPWLASIRQLEFNTDKWRTIHNDGEDVPAQPISEWRGQYIIPVLAGQLPNLEVLWLTVNWERCQPHPSTFGMFSQFTSLHELYLVDCSFPSFCTFRRILASLPALKALGCHSVHWPSVPQPSILVLPSRCPALQSFNMSGICLSCTLALLEWLIHTPTRSTLASFSLNYPGSNLHDHPITLPDRNLLYYAQIFAPSLRNATFGQIQSANDIAGNIRDLSRFKNLRSLQFAVNGTDWAGVADVLRSVPARLATFIVCVEYDWKLLGWDES
uniref:Peroxisomal biogenesis factor 6 (ClaPEX6) (Peroxin-6) n=1 Tax=Ganoderma boninense TaxID=34458 RepID=A0A5K1K781_9APHY|nr:Peroxisomal biogenesis factor 6 (ClaPEX6) (Peroxin-6) [Ganoderma boninense]